MINIIEYMFVFLVFLSIISFFTASLIHEPENPQLLLKLSEDVWRIFYLNGDLDGFNKNAMNEDVMEIYSISKLCIEFDKEDVTSYIPNKRASVVTKKIVFINHIPKIVTMTISVCGVNYEELGI